MREYLQGIAVALHDELHQTDDQVKDVLKLARSCDTMIMAKAKGAIGMTYALSGVPGDLVGKGIASAMKLEPGTPMHNFVAGVAGGMTAVAFKAVLTRVIGSSIQDSRWMQADVDALHPLMKDEAEKRDTFQHKLKMAALGGTGFNVRNPVTGGISSATQLLPENEPRPEPMGIIQGALKPGYAINQIAGFGLTSAAGALSGVVENYYDNLHGAEFLFGRNDWKDRYMALSSGRPNSGEGSHFDAVWEHAKTPKRWVEGVTALSALSAVASETMEALGLGIGAGAARVTKGGAEKLFTSTKTSAAETALDLAKKSSFRVSRESIGNAAALVPNAYSYLQQGVFGLLYQEAERAVANKLHPEPADVTEEEAPVSSGARTPEGAPAPSVGTEARTPAGTPAPSVGTQARTPAGTPAPSVGTQARTPAGTPAPSVGTEARTPAGTPAPSTGTRAKGPSEEGESDSDSVHSHNSGPLRNIPPERSSKMRAAGDTSAWWQTFPGLANIKSPQPEKLTQADYEAIVAVLEAEAEKMSERIAEMIPLPDSLPTSSASSVTSGSSASSEAAGPAGSPEPEETKKAS
uniref:Type III secretion system protein n=1 Tax=Enterobacter agglomerans TaxID=549 RepID=A0A0D5A0L6_ENTAG|nr:type III secretion system protein [Pantoea agglomerans]